MKLDSWNRQQNLERFDFIWADVQGAEGDLVDGGLETLSKTRFFYTEYSNREWYEDQVTLAQLTAKLPHFEIIGQTGRDVLLRNAKVSVPLRLLSYLIVQPATDQFSNNMNRHA
jgi:hypothetical protein